MTIQPARFHATLHGQTLGWYDTAEEAQAAIDAALEAEQRDWDRYNRLEDQRASQ